ncbi:MAG: RNA polymerase sigma factor [Verrucomicrobiales bacterium]|jgi:RNA polymerase sigma-70 factor (ECF subfamily)|nr:RNA polymerase sigma factor [Verrucomicrobiales bacterium]
MLSRRELEQIYREHGGALFAYLLNLSRSVTVSEDLSHELLLKLSQRSSLAWKFVRRPRSYLLRAAYALFVDYCRREQARTLMLNNFAQDVPLFEPDADTDHPLAAQTVAWLGDLPPEQRAVVHLKIWEQLTFREIAAQLGIPADTAASRYRYALDKLRARQRQHDNAHD